MKIGKILAFLFAGIVVVAVGAIVLGMIASLLHVLVPLAILVAIGFVAVKVYSAVSGAPAPKDEPKKLEEKKPDDAQPEPKKGMSEAEALAEFEAHRKKLGP